MSFQDAVRSLYAWHNAEVRSLADAAIQEMASEKPDDREEWLDRWLHETIDGHQHVIYTAQAQATLLASDNADAHEDVGVEAGDWSAMAYFALRADVQDLMEARRDEWDVDSDEQEEE